ncbi:hypothetical protein AB0J43_41585, partial [Nonomuraea fuscirosea]
MTEAAASKRFWTFGQRLVHGGSSNRFDGSGGDMAPAGPLPRGRAALAGFVVGALAVLFYRNQIEAPSRTAAADG